MSSQPFNRTELNHGDCEILSKGRWGNADLILCRKNGENWVVKDFSPCPDMVGKTWGRWMAGREYRALQKLCGIDGVPAEPFRLDALSFGYRYIPGTTLIDAVPGSLPTRYFIDLEKLVLRMHERRLVHLDLRHRRNILITESNTPALLDFQASLDLMFIPRVFHRLLTEIDISGIYKNWLRYCQEQPDEDRMNRYRAMLRRRAIWIFHGYPLWTRRARRK